MVTRTEVSKAVRSSVMGLLPALLYAGMVQADCRDELGKLKTAAKAYQSIDGRPILPDEIKSLMRERYDGKFAIRFDTEACLKTKLTYPISGGYEQLCAEYQQIRKKMGTWYNNSASDIQKEAYKSYRTWNERWVATLKECFSWDFGYEYMHQEQIDKLKAGGLVPSKNDR